MQLMINEMPTVNTIRGMEVQYEPDFNQLLKAMNKHAADYQFPQGKQEYQKFTAFLIQFLSLNQNYLSVATFDNLFQAAMAAYEFQRHDKGLRTIFEQDQAYIKQQLFAQRAP